MILAIPAAVVAAATVVAGMWAWQQAQDLVLDYGAAGRPDIEAWAIRSAAVAAIALAQVILLTLVVGRFYRRGVFDAVLALTSVIVFALATAGAVACGLAGR
jgi:hypothetical protein